jgi:hypothetical protein
MTKSKINANKRQMMARKSKKKGKIVVIDVDQIHSDDYMSSKEGEYFEKKDFKKIIDFDCDCYRIVDGKRHLLLKFRKNVIPKKYTDLGMVNLKKAAMKTHDNRGASAGVINAKKLPTYANEQQQFKKDKVSKFRIHGYKSKITGEFVKNSFGNIASSNIIGYFDKPDRNIGADKTPCRTTVFTSREVEKWNNVLPLLKSIDTQFKRIVPTNYKIQYDEAHKTKFVIDDTAFSTVTINHNWQTALHKDAGDLKEGFGNLTVIEEGNYDGGFTGFPQYGVAVDVRTGDFLAMDVHEWHSNTKIIPGNKGYSRLSLVCYLREKMHKCAGMSLK